MSSYKRIPKGNIQIQKNPAIFVNGEVVEDEMKLQQTTLQQMQEASLQRIREKEEKIMNVLEERKEEIMKQGYEDGKKIAMEEAEEKLRTELNELFLAANQVYEEANQYRKHMIEKTDKDRDIFVEEKREEVMDTIYYVIERILNQKVNPEEIQAELILEDMLKQIDYENKTLYVRVHPTTKKNIEEYFSDTFGDRVEWLVDLNLEPLDFVVETEREFIDGTMQKKLEVLKEELRGVLNDKSE